MEALANSKINWEIIYQTIEAEKCLLILGPEVYTSEGGQKLENRISDFLDVDNNAHVKKFYREDGLFLFPSEADKTATYYNLRQFFQEDATVANTLLQKIARIPFHFILNLTPDHRLEGVFDEMNLRSKFDFYWKNRTATSTDKLPTKQSPLVYNMFGSIEQRDSMVLSYQDLFDYFDSILGARSMPDELKSILGEIDNFIFLGVNFDRWYIQLLLRLLSKFNRRDSFLRYASGVNIKDDVATFCDEQFRIQFVKENIGSFVDGIYQEFEKKQALRVIGEQAASPIEKVMQLITKAKTKEAFQQLQAFLDNRLRIPDEVQDDFVTLHSRYNRLNRRINSGVLSQGDAEIAMNQIIESLLELVGRMKNYE